MKLRNSLILPIVGLMAFASAAQAALIVYEGFDYTNGTTNPDSDAGLNGGNGLPATNVGGNPSGTGVGLRNNWNGTVSSGSLSYTGALTSNANALSIGSGINQNNAGPWMYRNMATDPFASYRDGGNALGAAGTSLFGSMLVDMSGIATGDRFWFRLTGNDNTHNHITVYTADGGNWTIMQINDSAAGAAGTSLTINSAVAASTDTTLLVWQQDFGASSTTLSLWVNPANPTVSGLGTANYVFTTGGAVNLAGVGYRTGNNTAIIDELRIGTTFADVVAIPEPSTYALLAGVLGLGLAMYRRRRA